MSISPINFSGGIAHKVSKTSEIPISKAINEVFLPVKQGKINKDEACKRMLELGVPKGYVNCLFERMQAGYVSEEFARNNEPLSQKNEIPYSGPVIVL